MLYEVRFRCNHIHTMAVTGQVEERNRKIAWYNLMYCPECRAKHANSYAREVSRSVNKPLQPIYI